MLGLPEVGFGHSVAAHNVDVAVLCDWIEACAVFDDQEMSKTDIVDVLTEHNIYDSQDFAAEHVENAWSELRRRVLALGDVRPFVVLERSVKATGDWRDNTGYSFCLMLSLHAWYPGWARQFGNDFTAQGDLFEALVEEALATSGWSTLRAGWTPGRPARIRQVVSAVAQHLSETEIPGAIELWISEHANDEGLDVVCSRPFRDGRGGRPLFFIQCASGANWKQKLRSLDPLLWGRVIGFTTYPQCGVAMPFALAEDDFRRVSAKVNGLLLDRHRIASPNSNSGSGWESRKLRLAIASWMKRRMKRLKETAA